MTTTTLMGIQLTQEDVLRAIQVFDEQYPESNTFEGWLENPAYRYALLYAGKLYPPKIILSMASGLPRTALNSRRQRDRVYRQLGLQIVGESPLRP